jgi:hypothetical protein
MNVLISINDPVLLGTEYFLVRYRLAPAGVWIDLGIQSNAPFEITGLSAGDYELEVVFVNEDGVLCPAVISDFTVVADPPIDQCECMTVTNLSVSRNCDNTAVIHMDLGAQTGGCSLSITYTQFGNINPQTITYPQGSFPTSVNISTPDNPSSTPPSVNVTLSCCNGDTLICFDGQISNIIRQDCGCVVPYISGAWINYDPILDEYTLCINFTSLPGVDHDIYYKQQLSTNPIVFDEGTVPTTTDGYYEITLSPEAFTGDIQYYVKVTNDCGEDYRVIDIFRCGENINFMGGQDYPTTITVAINPYLNQSINIDPASVPDKFVLEINGVEVLNTGYIGSTSYQALLDAALIAEGDPTETITATTGTQTYPFLNSAGASYMQLKVYGPLENTSWNVVIECAAPPSGNVVTLIVENTPTSNVQTTQVHGTYAIPGSTINFSPYQDPNEEDTFINQQGWIGSISAGVLLKPIVGVTKIYKVEVLQNGSPIATNTYSYGGTSIFHLPVYPTGIVNGDTIRVRISSS